jgi:ubiquinone biosynthesis protein
MWDTSGPYVKEWIRGELGPEAAIADRINDNVDTLALLPGIIRRLDEQLPRKGGAPPPPPVAEVRLLWDRQSGRSGGGWWRSLLIAALGAALGIAGTWLWQPW